MINSRRSRLAASVQGALGIAFFCLSALALLSCREEIAPNLSPPILSVTPDSLDFGNVVVGSIVSRSVRISNAGGGSLAGSLGTSCAEFAVVGDSSFSIPAGASTEFRIVFSPGLNGVRRCSVVLHGLADRQISVHGTGRPHRCPSGSDLDCPAPWDVPVGESDTRTFTIRNPDPGTLAGTVTPDCPDLVVVSGAEFSLQQDQTTQYTLRFTPSRPGSIPCHVRVGAPCDTIKICGFGIPGVPGYLKWGGEGRATGQFEYPSGIAADSEGNVYVVDSGNDRVQKFTPDGRFVLTFGDYGAYPGEFDGPAYIAVGPSGHVYVTDSGNFRVSEFTPDGGLVRQWSTGTQSRPVGVAVAASGQVYLGLDSGRIEKYSATGDSLAVIGTPYFRNCLEYHPPVAGNVFIPRGIALDRDGNLYVADFQMPRVQVFDPNGAPLRVIEAQIPEGIAVDSSGHVWVSEGQARGSGCNPYATLHRIEKFGPAGNSVLTFGTEGEAEGQFHGPSGVAIGKGGFLYVADTYNHRIQRFPPGYSGKPNRPRWARR